MRVVIIYDRVGVDFDEGNLQVKHVDVILEKSKTVPYQWKNVTTKW